MGAVQLTVKAVDDGKRIIEGVASTPAPDRMGDIVEPMGARFSVPMPLLWQHRHDAPVGRVVSLEATPRGIAFRAEVARVEEPGTLRDRIEEAWQSVKAGLVGAVSIGFRSLDGEPIRNGGMKFTSWEFLELSLVTIPANADARIGRWHGKSATTEAPGARLERTNAEIHARALAVLSEEMKASRGPLKFTDGALSGMVRAMGSVTAGLLGEVARLEQRLAAVEGRKMMSYKGVYAAGHAYEEGDAVTHRGSMWVCCSPTSGAPGEIGAASGCWRLAVRKGKDGHNAKGVRNHEDN